MLKRILICLGLTLFFAGYVSAQEDRDLKTLKVITTALAPAELGKHYQENLQAEGGTEPYQWHLRSGHLPAGITLNRNGVLAGTPRTAGDFTFVVEVKDRSKNKKDVEIKNHTQEH